MITIAGSGPHSGRGPIFVVGMNGSGTTMMLDHIGHHPDLFGFKLETYVLPHYLLKEDTYGDLSQDKNFRRLWDDLRREYAFRCVNNGRPIDMPSDWAESPRSAAGVFDRIMRHFAERDGKERWCEKTPMHALHISTIAGAFPEACFIHMMRDGRACAASNKRRWGRHPANTVYRWKQVVAEARRQGALLGKRYMEIRYEDLTERPEQYMQAVCSFVMVEFDERVLLASRSRPRMVGKQSKTIVRNEGVDVSPRPSVSLELLERIAGKQLAVLGYSTQFPDGDLNPALVRLLWWNAHDVFAVIVRRLKVKLTFQKHMTWSLFFARWQATIRQARHLSLGGRWRGRR